MLLIFLKDASMEKFGYMCLIDFEDELYRASGGNTVYPSIEDLRKNHTCVDSCGIVKVKVELVEIISRGTVDNT